MPFQTYADLIQSATPHDADMLMLGAVMFAVPQFVLAALWIWWRATFHEDE